MEKVCLLGTAKNRPEVIDYNLLFKMLQLPKLDHYGEIQNCNNNNNSNNVMECYIASQPKLLGYRKRMLSMCLEDDMFWISEKHLLGQANVVRMNRWMREIEL